MDIIKPRIMKGTRDFLPDDMRVREHVIGIIKKRFETYGFAPLATPAMEYYDILTGKYGDEGEGLIFDLAYKGGREVALKYDLTVPMCRVIAQYQDKIVMPFKRYQIQPVWRAEKPQRGRLREFFQCDADIVGVRDAAADTEIIALITDVMGDLGFESSVTLVNHRKLLAGIMAHIGIIDTRAAAAMRVLDKLDKVGEEAVRAEFAEAKFPAAAIDSLFSLTETTGDAAADLARMGGELSGNELAAGALADLTKIFRLLSEAGIDTSARLVCPAAGPRPCLLHRPGLRDGGHGPQDREPRRRRAVRRGDRALHRHRRAGHGHGPGAGAHHRRGKRDGHVCR